VSVSPQCDPSPLSMADSFPSRFEMKLSGCALVCSQVMLCVAAAVYSLEDDVYEVRSEDAVIAMHHVLSSSTKRAEVKIVCGILWFTFPLMLIALYGIRKLSASIYAATSAEIFIYLAEKAYIMWIAVVCIILPALMLVSVGYEWSFHEFTPDDDFTPTGYYVQLAVHTLAIETADCVAIADATFMISLFLLPRMLLIYSADAAHFGQKYKKLKFAMEPSFCHRTTGLAKCGLEICTNCLVLSLVVVFCLVLFTFAESGFFAPSGGAQFLIFWSIAVKLMMGARMCWFGWSGQWEEVRDVIVANDPRRMSRQQMLGGQDLDHRSTSLPKNDDNVL